MRLLQAHRPFEKGIAMMVIQLPEWDGWRIEGEGRDWQLQVYEPNGAKDGGPRWRATNYWPSLEHAIGHAYERTLRELPKTVDIRDVPAECERVKARLLKAVRKAVAS